MNVKLKLIKPRLGDCVKINNWLFFKWSGSSWLKMTDSDIDELEKDQKKEQGTEDE